MKQLRSNREDYEYIFANKIGFDYIKDRFLISEDKKDYEYIIMDIMGPSL